MGNYKTLFILIDMAILKLIYVNVNGFIP